MMSKFRFLIIGGILLLTLMAIMPVYGAESNSVNIIEEDNPVVCEVCPYACSLWFDSTQVVYPGHHAEIFVKAKSERTIGRIHIKTACQTGLTYVGYDTAGTEWKGGIRSNSSGSNIEFQCSTLAVAETLASGDWHFLFKLTLDLDSTVVFSSTDTIYKVNDYPEFSETCFGSPCTGKQRRSKVSTYSGSCGFRAVATTGYSYQAQTDTSWAIKVPVIFSTSFPTDYIRIAILPEDSVKLIWDGRFIKSDSSNAVFGSDSAGYVITDSTTLYPAGSRTTIGWLRCKGPNYQSSYNSSTSFSRNDTISFTGSSTCKAQCDSSSVSIGWSSMSDTLGWINYPVYRCTTSVGNANVTNSLRAIVPVLAKHSFYSQYFKYYIKYDKRCLTLDLDSVTTISGGHYQSVDADSEYTDGNYRRIMVETSPTYQGGAYVAPLSNDTIFKMNFAVTDSFANVAGDTTRISIYPDTISNMVLDYFQPSGSKISRYDESTSVFSLQSGIVTMPTYLDVKIDTVVYNGKTTVNIPLRITRITQNSYDSVYLKISCPDTSNFRFVNIDTEPGPFSTLGDFSVGKGAQTLSANRSILELKLRFSSGELDNEGVLGYIRCQKVGTPSGFSRLLFIDDGFVAYDGATEVDATLKVDGGIDDGVPKLDPNESEIAVLPNGISLSQNYPNPFNLKTTIVFGIPQAGMVSLDIFDILGRHVKTGVNSYLEAGEHTYLWDGTNDAGNTVGTGFYIYNLQSREFKQTKKMLLLK